MFILYSASIAEIRRRAIAGVAQMFYTKFMRKTATVRTRTEPALKQDVEDILSRLGLTCSEAIGIFFRQVTVHRGLPFPVTIPNGATAKAIAGTRLSKGTRTFASAKDWAKAARRR